MKARRILAVVRKKDILDSARAPPDDRIRTQVPDEPIRGIIATRCDKSRSL